jgi:hypothetical protein
LHLISEKSVGSLIFFLFSVLRVFDGVFRFSIVMLVRMNTSGTLRFKPCGVALVFAAFFLLYLTVFRDSSSKSGSLLTERKTGGGSHVSARLLLAVAIEAAVAGGNEVRAVRRHADLEEKSKGKTKEGVNDPVTAGDFLHSVIN